MLYVMLYIVRNMKDKLRELFRTNKDDRQNKYQEELEHSKGKKLSLDEDILCKKINSLIQFVVKQKGVVTKLNGR